MELRSDPPVDRLLRQAQGCFVDVRDRAGRYKLPMGAGSPFGYAEDDSGYFCFLRQTPISDRTLFKGLSLSSETASRKSASPFDFASV
jgi:hypothetical protein